MFRKKEKKFSGLILDNEMTRWSVCLECCAPLRCFKRHKCENILDNLKNMEIETVNAFTRNMTKDFRCNVRQIDVDRVRCKHCHEILKSAEAVKIHLKSTHNIYLARLVNLNRDKLKTRTQQK